MNIPGDRCVSANLGFDGVLQVDILSNKIDQNDEKSRPAKAGSECRNKVLQQLSAVDLLIPCLNKRQIDALAKRFNCSPAVFF